MIKSLWNKLWDRFWHRMQAKCDNDPVCVKLRQELGKVGKDFELKDYNELLKPSEEISFSKIIDGIEMFFSAEAYNVKKNGDIFFSIDADTKSPKIRIFNQHLQACFNSDRRGKNAAHHFRSGRRVHR